MIVVNLLLFKVSTAVIKENWVAVRDIIFAFVEFVMKRKPRATIKGGFGVGLRLEPMFTFSVVNVHQAEGKIHTLYLKCGYVTLEKWLSQALQQINNATAVTCIVAFLTCKQM